jgi:putative toxin-antitoxin system antitoxin component (TIGR02293 family)
MSEYKEWSEIEIGIEKGNEAALVYTTNQKNLISIANPIFQTRKGLTGSHLQLVRKQTELDFQELAKITQVTTRTLHNKKNDDPLGITVSEKLISLVRLFEKGTEVFGSEIRFKKWLRTELPILNYESPLHQLDTVFGFELVYDLLGRIEYGVLA